MIRLYGFDRVPAALPAIGGSDGPRTPAQLRRDRIRRELVGYGYAEAIDFAFQSRTADGTAPALVAGEPLALVNPLSERHAVLRRSLVPNLVESARFNRRRGAEAVRLFEVGHVFARLPEGPARAAGADGPAGRRAGDRGAGLRRRGGDAVGTADRARPLRPQGRRRGAGRGARHAAGGPAGGAARRGAGHRRLAVGGRRRRGGARRLAGADRRARRRHRRLPPLRRRDRPPERPGWATGRPSTATR